MQLIHLHKWDYGVDIRVARRWGGSRWFLCGNFFLFHPSHLGAQCLGLHWIIPGRSVYNGVNIHSRSLQSMLKIIHSGSETNIVCTDISRHSSGDSCCDITLELHIHEEGEHNLKDGKIACGQYFSLGVFFFLTAGFEGKGDDILTRAGGLHPCKNVNPRRA